MHWTSQEMKPGTPRAVVKTEDMDSGWICRTPFDGKNKCWNGMRIYMVRGMDTLQMMVNMNFSFEQVAQHNAAHKGNGTNLQVMKH